MDAIAVDAEGNAGEPGRMTPRAMVAAAVGLASLLLLALGAYWLIARDLRESGATATIVEAKPDTPAPAGNKAAPPAAEPLIAAPPPTCVDGKPARPEIPADACL